MEHWDASSGCKSKALSMKDHWKQGYNINGIEVEEIISKLKSEYGLCIKKMIDVRTLAKLHFPISYLGKPGLKVLAYQLLQLRPWKSKNVCMNNLESRFLDTKLIKFACIDAYVPCAIGTELLL